MERGKAGGQGKRGMEFRGEARGEQERFSGSGTDGAAPGNGLEDIERGTGTRRLDPPCKWGSGGGGGPTRGTDDGEDAGPTRGTGEEGASSTGDTHDGEGGDSAGGSDKVESDKATGLPVSPSNVGAPTNSAPPRDKTTWTWWPSLTKDDAKAAALNAAMEPVT